MILDVFTNEYNGVSGTFLRRTIILWIKKWITDHLLFDANKCGC